MATHRQRTRGGMDDVRRVDLPKLRAHTCGVAAREPCRAVSRIEWGVLTWQLLGVLAIALGLVA